MTELELEPGSFGFQSSTLPTTLYTTIYQKKFPPVIWGPEAPKLLPQLKSGANWVAWF